VALINSTFSKHSDFLLSPETGRAGSPFKRTLILGYGNPDRQDDGVAVHILEMLAKRL